MFGLKLNFWCDKTMPHLEIGVPGGARVGVTWGLKYSQLFMYVNLFLEFFWLKKNSYLFFKHFWATETLVFVSVLSKKKSNKDRKKEKKDFLPDRDLNPGLPGDSQVS